MADYSTINTVPAANIATVGGVAKASIANMHGLTTPSSGGDQWVIGFEDGGMGHAASSDLSSWTTFYGGTGGAGENVDFTNCAYGKDGNGDPLWVYVWTRANQEIRIIGDITAGAGSVGGINLTPSDAALQVVEWANDMWVAFGDMDTAHCFTSPDGSTWTERDLSGLSGVNNEDVYGVTTNGAGVWIFVQADRIYRSEDNAATFALSHDFNNNNVNLKNIVYLKDEDCFVLMRHQQTGSKFWACPASDTSDWSANDATSTLGYSARKCIAAGGSTVVAAYLTKYQRMTVSGTTITLDNSGTAQDLPFTGNSDKVTDCATDGAGNWVITHETGKISKSTDDGVTFSSAATGVDVAGVAADDKITTVAVNVYKPM